MKTGRRDRGFFVNLRMQNDKLIQLIQEFGSTARDHYQVSKRMEQVLDDRLAGIVQALRDSDDEILKSADVERSALVSEDYLNHLNELINVKHQSHQARVQYETHMMLFEARRTLRAFRK